MKNPLIYLIYTAAFLFTCSDFLYASGTCGEPTYPDQASFVPEPSPETCEGKWVIVEDHSTMFDCPVTGDYSDLVSTEDGYNFEVIEGSKKLEQKTVIRHWGIDCRLPSGFQHCNDNGSIYEFDSNNPLHYSCIANFHSGIPGSIYVHDHCVWLQVEVPGWQCKRSYWAQHHKTLYEWECD